MSRQHQNGPNGHPSLRGCEAWRDWPEVRLRVAGLPFRTTWPYYAAFTDAGNICRVDVTRTSDDIRNPTAEVVFCPPPRSALWDHRYIHVEFEGQTYKAVITLLKPGKERVHRSPVVSNRVYPERTELRASRLDIGLMHTSNTMMTMSTIRPTSLSPISLVLRLFPHRRVVAIEFSVADDSSGFIRGAHELRRYQFEIDVSSSITEVFEDATHPDVVSLVFPSLNPPNVYRRVRENDWRKTHNDKAAVWREGSGWPRVTKIRKPNFANAPSNGPQMLSSPEPSTTPIRLNQENLLIDIGRWNTFRMVFTLEDAQARRNYDIICSILRDYNVTVKSGPGPALIPKQKSTLWKQINELASASNTQLLGHQIYPFPFDVRYQLEVCVSQGVINEHNITAEFLTALLELGNETARQVLEKTADTRKRWFDPMEIIRQFRFSTRFNRRIPEYCCYSRGVTVTPTTMYFHSPAVETSNRVTRKYERHGVEFIRVKFTDERTWGKMRRRHERDEDAVYDRFQQAFRHGIQVGPKVFHFLAWGNSQFRENGAYFISPTSRVSADSIRAWMGDVAHIRVIAKYAARLGQNFSTTRSYRGSPVETVEIPDIERNGHCFTDGVGKMSRFIAQMIAGRFHLPFATEDPPSVIQFRYGGCKGVLAIDPTMATKQAHQIHIRPSQRKFEVREGGLEITRCSDFSVATLNRQLIVILSFHGIPDQVFDDMRKQMVRNLNKAMHDQEAAMRQLQRSVDMNQTSLVLASMVADGFMATREPFLMNCLALWRCWNMKLLKEKARLVVDQAAFLLGCVDETGLLQGHFDEKHARHHKRREDMVGDLPQIFVQVGVAEKPGEQKRYRVITGVCILARNPSLHPGDIRVVNAVDVPQLHHLKNVVVLPQTGDRDLASMCSGGDLDGDDYFVSWDEKLIFSNWTYPPMAHSAPPPREVDRPVVMEDLFDFFIEYMKNDSLPTIATAHLAMAAQLGVESNVCLELAELHSLAVDYPKSGRAVQMDPTNLPRRWPHFMERRAKSYRSTHILGQLYDRVSSVDFRPVFQGFNADVIASYQTVLEPEHWEQLKQRAQTLKEEYDHAIRRIQARHDIRSEFEVWTVYCLGHNGERRDYAFAEEMGRDVGGLKERFRSFVRDEADKMGEAVVNPQFRGIVYEAAGARLDVQEVDLTLHPFLAAMYCVTADEAMAAIRQSRMTEVVDEVSQPLRNLSNANERPMMSFPWLFYEELGKLSRFGGLLRVRMRDKVKCAEISNPPLGLSLDYDQTPVAGCDDGQLPDSVTGLHPPPDYDQMPVPAAGDDRRADSLGAGLSDRSHVTMPPERTVADIETLVSGFQEMTLDHTGDAKSVVPPNTANPNGHELEGSERGTTISGARLGLNSVVNSATMAAMGSEMPRKVDEEEVENNMDDDFEQDDGPDSRGGERFNLLLAFDD